MRSFAANTARWSAIGLGFSLPISVAVDNILFVLAILGWLAAGDLSQKLRTIRSNPVAMAALLFAGVMLLGMSWSPQPLTGLKESIVEALRFALLGVLVTVFTDERTRHRAMAAFLASSVLVLAISFILWSGLVAAIPGVKGNPGYPVVFKFHITHNVLMAIAAVLFLLRAVDAQGRKRGLYALLTAAAAFNIFYMIPGRTGQLAFAAALLYVACSRFRWLGMATAGAGLAAVVAVSWVLPNSVMHQRATLALEEASAWQPDQAQSQRSSIGMRLEFYRNSLHMIASRPLLGTGTGGFPSAYAAQIANTTMVPTQHPHNAYLLVAAELGVLGLAALIGLLLVQWRSAARLPLVSERTAARGLLVVFLIAGMVSSTFNDHVEGLFFVWASALLWAAVRPPQTQ